MSPYKDPAAKAAHGLQWHREARTGRTSTQREALAAVGTLWRTEPEIRRLAGLRGQGTHLTTTLFSLHTLGLVEYQAHGGLWRKATGPEPPQAEARSDG